MTPGPKEPTTAELNGYLEPLMSEFDALDNGLLFHRLSIALLRSYLLPGLLFDVFDSAEQKTVHGILPRATADTPARLKIAGLVSQNSGKFLCYMCDKWFNELVVPSCFNRESECFFNVPFITDLFSL